MVSRNNTLNYRLNRGFTIVELLIVIVVIAILATITIVAYNGIQDRANKSAAASTAQSVNQKIQASFIVNRIFPSTIADCPTPLVGNLCISLSPGTEATYTQYPANTGSGYRIYKEASYDLGIMNERAFVYTGVGERTAGGEFMQYADLAPYIDRYGSDRKYQLSFDIKSTTSATGNVRVYLQNGSGSRHTVAGVLVPATTTYTRQTVTFTPTLESSGLTMSLLAFYGTYGTNVISAVKNVQFSLAP